MTIEQGRQLLAQVKERFRSRCSLAFFSAAHRELNLTPNDGMEWYQRRPHLLLLFAKWALAYWRPNDDRPEPTDEDIRYVFQNAWDAVGKLHRVEDSPAIFFRRMVLQQVWFQRSFDTSSIARQFRIVGELMEASAAAVDFERHTGMSPADFAKHLAHMAADMGDLLEITALSEQRPDTPPDPDKWLAIRAMYSKSVPELHKTMLELEQRGTPAEVEVCEQSPLIQTPFLNTTTHGPACIHHKLLFRMLETAVFDVARALGPRPFMDVFGPEYENYLAEVLADLNATVIRERALMGMLEGSGRVVDFVVVSDDALVLIDAKGIEGHYDELYHNLPTELAARLRTSLLKAVDQAVETVTRLPGHLRRPEVYFICATFKQVAVGDGTALRDLTVGTAEWEHDRWRTDVLPPVHMFFASVQELESMVSLSVARQVPLSHIVREFVQTNTDPVTRKALLEMHVMSHRIPFFAPQCVQAAAQRLRA